MPCCWDAVTYLSLLQVVQDVASQAGECPEAQIAGVLADAGIALPRASRPSSLRSSENRNANARGVTSSTSSTTPP